MATDWRGVRAQLDYLERFLEEHDGVDVSNAPVVWNIAASVRALTAGRPPAVPCAEIAVTPIAALWQELCQIWRRSNELNAAWAKIVDALPATMQENEAEMERCGVTAIQDEEEACDWRCDELHDQMFALLPASVCDVLTLLELFRKRYGGHLNPDPKEVAALDTIILGLRGLADGPVPIHPV